MNGTAGQDASRAERVWLWLHSQNWITHLAHAGQALLLMAAGFLIAGIVAWSDPAWINPAASNATIVVGLGLLIGSLLIVTVFTHREIGDIAVATFRVIWPGKQYEDRLAAQRAFRAKIDDGIGDWWAPVLVVPVTALVLALAGLT